MDYRDFFKTATGDNPFPYQEIFAISENLPDILRVPTGAGKTATAILGWLWRRLHAQEEIRRSTPARLVYCLPMRVLVEQTMQNASLWLAKLNLTETVGLHILMGGEAPRDWCLFPEKPSILIGTQDMLLSRALNRGYGMSRYRWPLEFGLLNNDCLWVFDEVQLMGTGLATSAQVHAFREIFGTAAPGSSLWMSATLEQVWLNTVDFTSRSSSLKKCEISSADRKVEALGKRLAAGKKLLRCQAVESKSLSELAKNVREHHRSGSLTLVVMNTVDRAVELYRALKGSAKKGNGPDLLLIHSRFRPEDRRGKIARLPKPDSQDDLIVVTTQVIEAGVDVSARTLFTELAPWPSLVQRFGRCNRRGEYNDAEIHWIDVKTDKAAKPYELTQLEAARKQLEQLPDVSPDLLTAHLATQGEEERERLFPYSPTHVVRRKDLIELFDTTPDLAGNDIDISRFIRDGEELDVQVYWRTVEDRLPPEAKDEPRREELCSVPFHKFKAFLREKRKEKLEGAYLWNGLSGKWEGVREAAVFPGRTYLIPSDQGGYDPEHGWDEKAAARVSAVAGPDNAVELDANDKDRLARRKTWQRIRDHTDMVIDCLTAMLGSLGFALNDREREALLTAARWHDRGKAHHVFQGAIVRNGLQEGNDWAKAPKMERYGRRGFRHELASALAMLQAGKSDLACYLAVAHHGKVRLSIRSLPTEDWRKDLSKRFARGISDGDELPQTDVGGGVFADTAILSLEPMEMGLSANGEPSWAERMLRLRDDKELGPFRLAFLEALLRAADMRASGIEGDKKDDEEAGHGKD